MPNEQTWRLEPVIAAADAVIFLARGVLKLPTGIYALSSALDKVDRRRRNSVRVHLHKTPQIKRYSNGPLHSVSHLDDCQHKRSFSAIVPEKESSRIPRLSRGCTPGNSRCTHWREQLADFRGSGMRVIHYRLDRMSRETNRRKEKHSGNSCRPQGNTDCHDQFNPNPKFCALKSQVAISS